MAEFAYNNAKNASTCFLFFEQNCEYHLKIFYKKNVDSSFKFKSANKLSA